MTVDSAFLDRFRRDVAAALRRPFGPDGTLALAVSGGPDSMAMLLLAVEAYPGRVLAATVDHRLRPEGADEAATVARWCAERKAPHATLAIEVPPGASGNLQDWARQERYLLLKRWALGEGAVALCTAHHADDQAETFLMRAARGSGLSGLAGVRARVDDTPSTGPARMVAMDGGIGLVVEHAPLVLLRPLLGWRRGELRAIAEANGLPIVDDPSNRDARFDRTRFRDLLAAAPWLDASRVARSADNLAAVDADLRAIGDWLWTERRVGDDPYEASFDAAGLPRGVLRYMVRTAIDAVRGVNGIGGDAWRSGGSVEGILDALEIGGKATRAGVLASAKGTVWRFREAPPRRSS